MPTLSRLCAECGEPIAEGRLLAIPSATQCLGCASDAQVSRAPLALPKALSENRLTTTHHLRRYLGNVGKKTEVDQLFRVLVRVCYLFSHISPTEIRSVVLAWCQRTGSPFTQEQLMNLLEESRAWAERHHRTDLPKAHRRSRAGR